MYNFGRGFKRLLTLNHVFCSSAIEYLQSKVLKNFINEQFFLLLDSENLKLIFIIEGIFLQCITSLIHLVLRDY